MRRKGALLTAVMALLIQGILAQDAKTVEVTLALKDSKTTYRMGEPIVLDLSFRTTTRAVQITTERDSPNDEIVISPLDGVFPWRQNSPFANQTMMDDMAFSLSPRDPPLHILRPVNALYRIDNPGHYSVHVTTHRVQFLGESLEGVPTHVGKPLSITTNEVSFDVEEMSESEEQSIVDRLISEMRASFENLMPLFNAAVAKNTSTLTPDQKAKGKESAEHMFDLKDELDWLSGDASTRAKVYLYLHPAMFGPFSSVNLWTARNRTLVVSLLEEAMKDSSIQPVGDIAQLTEQMKATLAGQSPKP